MKNEQEHLMLWQKRNEWQIDDNAQQDWLAMSDMLDTQMPVIKPGPGGGSSYLSVFKLGALLAAAVATAVIVYFVFVKDHTKTNSRQKADTMVNSNNQNLNKGAVSRISGDGDSLNSERPAANNSSNNALTNADVKHGSLLTDNPAPVNPHGGVDAAKNSGSDKDNSKTTDASDHGTANPSRSTSTAKNPAGANYHDKTMAAAPGKTNNKTAGSTSHNNAMVAGMNRAGSNDNTLPIKSKKISTGNKNKLSHSTLARNGRLHSDSHAGGLADTNKNNNGGKTSLNANTGNKDGLLTDAAQTINNINHRDTTMAVLLQPQVFIEPYIIASLNPALISKTKAKLDSAMAAQKPPVAKPLVASKFDYGVLAGINTSGSFTATDKNKNFYGSFPIDMFLGAFTTYNFNNKLGIGLQLRGLNPQTISGTYAHKNDSKKDTNQVLTITDSRKIYTTDMALHLIFKPVMALSLKAGPVFSYALKEANGNTTFQTGPLKKDSLYYVSVTKLVNTTTFSKSLNIGLSVGASYQYGRFIFDAAYIRNFSGTVVGSTLGSYTAVRDQFLFSIGFKLNKTR